MSDSFAEGQSLLQNNNNDDEAADNDDDNGNDRGGGTGGQRFVDSSRIVEQFHGKPRQRLLLFLHFFFKVVSFFLYVFANLIGLGFRTAFVLLLLMLSVDFYLVKNLSGRLLAGLRWWRSEPDGAWRFEVWTREQRQKQVSYSSQSTLFWTGLVAQQVVWSTLLLAAVFSIHLGWFVFTVIACSLNGANLYGYVRCRLQRREEEMRTRGFFARMQDGLVGLFIAGRKSGGGGYTRAEQQQEEQDY